MRLIDADNIKWQKILEPLGNGMYVDGYVANKRDIDVMPTVETIPIEAIPISYIAAEIFQLHEYRNNARKREEKDEILESISCLENLVRRYREKERR